LIGSINSYFLGTQLTDCCKHIWKVFTNKTNGRESGEEEEGKMRPQFQCRNPFFANFCQVLMSEPFFSVETNSQQLERTISSGFKLTTAAAAGTEDRRRSTTGKC